MSRVILLDLIAPGRTAAALMENGRLEDLLIDPMPGDTTPVPGEIHSAKIDRLVPKLGAAFVKLGGGAIGFLREAKGRREGETLCVQVVSYPEPGKASPVSARVLHKGRYVIHTPDAPGINVSRQIRDEAERARLAAIGDRALADARAALPTDRTAALSHSGLILRSAAEGAAAGAIEAEARSVLSAHLAILDDPEASRRPTVLARVAAAGTALRDWTDPLPARIWHAGALGGGDLDGLDPELADRCRPSDTGDLFDAHGIWEERDRLMHPRAALPADASFTIEPTAALVAVDVNTGGGFQGGDALSANLAAARELPRQLRLRGLGGIVTVDFAPLPKKDRRRIEDALKTAFRRDPVETSLAGWTPSGLFELQRKRERRPLAELVG
ncbi:MAG: ribonuclease E/G [Paracoccaceae bacterium]